MGNYTKAVVVVAVVLAVDVAAVYLIVQELPGLSSFGMFLLGGVCVYVGYWTWKVWTRKRRKNFEDES